MYLKSLTIKGFKSFASATTLNFEPGITAIVGPNGSGKSNIVDALSWVMGEQGAKSLRGGKMEDVIFAGTTGRAPLGRAEVALTIDNTDGALPIEYTEVTISRTLFRAGGSEYAINGSPVRLLDVQELLSDTGMGREMHVIVGQGQLDQILQATPEIRRGFIEEAAGVLKHRRRKEKATRKLASTEQNLDRLNDLVREIRRQLKPLGRQAEVARRAAVVQSELRDARARLLADDLTQAQLALESDLADEQAAVAQRAALERAVEAARAEEAAAEAELAELAPQLNQAQENWYALAALRERVATTMSISAERMRHGAEQPTLTTGRDPETLEAEAEKVKEEEQILKERADAAAEALSDATENRNQVERDQAEADRAYNAQLRAIADRREGLARLTGQTNSLKSRLEAGDEEDARLEQRRDEAIGRAEAADREFAKLETQIAGVGDGEAGLDEAYETAEEEREKLQTEADAVVRALADKSQERASLMARVEALELGLERRDASGALLADKQRADSVLGALSALISVEKKWQTAVSAALGQTTDAVAVADLAAAASMLGWLKDADLGRAGLIIADAPFHREGWPKLSGAVWAIDVVKPSNDALRPALTRALDRVALVDDLAAAQELVAAHPDVTAVTVAGDVVSSWLVVGGSDAKASLLEVQAAVDAAREQTASVEHDIEKLTFERSRITADLERAEQASAIALDRLNESDAAMAALAEQLGNLGQTSRSARAEADRLAQSLENARAARSSDRQKLADLEERLALASAEGDLVDPDPTLRDQLSADARAARAAEMEARLALRTAEERVRSLAGRADSLFRAAANERASRAKAAARAEKLRREAAIATAVNTAANWLAARVDSAKEAAGAERTAAEAARQLADQRLAQARAKTREESKALDTHLAGAHRNELARIELKMRVEQLQDKALTELGLDPQVLLDEYGPELMIPVLVRKDGSAVAEDDEDQPEPIPFDREQQSARLRKATKDLETLGRVNPLALEEFEAMSERHAFLAEQLEDVKKTRKDLLDLIDDVDNRVEQVFTSAYADIERTFTDVFSRLFPGGEGRLILTDPDNMLTTGVDVEARPAGKKVKRLSLLSGGERSLVAVAFLVSLFIARPSPFYILDEVEAALDDVNLGRLLGIYEELRQNSQLLVITHQKRTMEIADSLYGVTMRQDGVSTVISQRLS